MNQVAFFSDFNITYHDSWKQGQYPKWDNCDNQQSHEVYRAVLYDQTYRLYSVFKDDLEEFNDWVAMTYHCENEPQGEEEDNRTFFDRMGIEILERPSISFKEYIR